MVALGVRRVLFETDDGAMIFLHSWCRMDMTRLDIQGPLLSGRIEINNERYAWLNETHVGSGGSFSQAVGPALRARRDALACRLWVVAAAMLRP